jgi:alkylation response protein AidB-like acyl-CoA dehydrogenase
MTSQLKSLDNPVALKSRAETESRLLDRARELMPVVQARAAEAEKHRRMPAETDREFREAGFYRVLQPAAFGGLELSYGFHTQLAEEIGRGCPSSAWILGVIACHSWIFGMFPPEAQREFWSGPLGDPSATLATSFFPDGATVKREGDGFRLNGRWKFSSGVDHCQGLVLMGFARPISNPANTGGAAGAPAPPVPYFLFVPRANYKIEDTWHSAGLIATGSNDVILDNVFVPAHHSLEVMQSVNGKSPGGMFHESFLYRLPLFAVFGYTLVGTALGGAQGALDFVADNLKARSSSTAQSNAPPNKQREQESVQVRVAEAAAEIQAARAVLRVDRERINEQGRAGNFPGDEERVTYRLNLGYATKLCVSAVERLYPLSGAQNLAADNPLQRAFRDVHAVSLHVGLRWDLNAVNFGAVKLGLKCPDPRV